MGSIVWWAFRRVDACRVGPRSFLLPDFNLALNIELEPKLTGRLLRPGQRLWREGNMRTWTMRSSTLFAL